MKMQSYCVLAIVIACFCFAGHLAVNVFKVPPVVFPSAEADRLSNQISKLKTEILSLENQRINPGPEPSWFWHPIDHSVWKKKSAVYLEISRLIEDRQTTLKNCENDLHSLAHSVWPKIWTSVCGFAKWLWYALFAPVLHILLIITLLSLSLRVFLRWMLMENKFGNTRV